MKSPIRKKPAAPESVADSDDISLISDDDDDIPLPVDTRFSGGTPQPKSWAQVDMPQLKQLAQRIAQQTLPDTDKGHEPLLLSSSTTPSASQRMPLDPLGLGVGGAARNTATATNFPLAPPPTQPSTQPPVQGWDDARLQPSSASYDPELHAVAAYRDVPWSDLLRGLDRLRTEVKEHTGQLKALVKENFDRFLSSKDTVDDIAGRLRAAEAEGGAGVHGATPGEVASGLDRSREAAQSMFHQLLERHGRGESLHVMLGMLGEYDSLVGLPAEVRQSAEARDFGRVLILYKKAVKVVEERSNSSGGGGVGNSRAVWEKLQAEVNRAMASAVHVLVATVDSPSTPLTTAAEAAHHLGQFRQAGVPAATNVDPIPLFLSAQSRGIAAVIEAAHRECTSALESFENEYEQQKRRRQISFSIDITETQHQQQQQYNNNSNNNLIKLSSQRWWEDINTTIGGGGGETSSSSSLRNQSYEHECLLCLWDLTEYVIGWSVQMWTATTTTTEGNKNRLNGQYEGGGSGSGGDNQFWQPHRTSIQSAVQHALQRYCEVVESVAGGHLRSEAAWEAAGSTGVASSLLESLVTGCTVLQQQQRNNATLSSPNSGDDDLSFAVDILLKVVVKMATAAAAACEKRLLAVTQAIATEACSLENISLGTFCTLPPAASSMRLLLSCAMMWCADIRSHCTQIGIDPGRICCPDSLLSSLATAFIQHVVSNTHQQLSSSSSFTRTTSTAAAAPTLDHITTTSTTAKSTTTPLLKKDSQLLHAWAAIRCVATKIVPQVAAAWNIILSTTESTSTSFALKKCCQDAELSEDAVIRAYLDRKLSILDHLMEKFLSIVVPDNTTSSSRNNSGPASAKKLPPSRRVSPQFLADTASLVTGWNICLAPRQARAVVWSVVAAVAAIRTEVLSSAPELCLDVMVEVLQGVLGGVSELLNTVGLINCAAVGSVYQLWLDVAVLAAVLECRKEEWMQIAVDVKRVRGALESAVAAGLKRCGEEDSVVYQPPSLKVDLSNGGGGGGGKDGGGGGWSAVSIGEHRRWVESVCAEEIGRAAALVKAFES